MSRAIDEILAAFAPLQHLPAWNVRRGHGAYLTFEFGAPRLCVREPVAASNVRSRRIRKKLARRHVSLEGEWHFWIYECDWIVREGNRIAGSQSSRARRTRAAALLNAQILTRVEIPSRGTRFRFHFDHGASLETIPFDRTSHQWMLYEPDGRVLTIRAGRRYAHDLATISDDDLTWSSF